MHTRFHRARAAQVPGSTPIQDVLNGSAASVQERAGVGAGDDPCRGAPRGGPGVHVRLVLDRRLWVPETLRASRGVRVLVQDAAESIASYDVPGRVVWL